MKEIKMDNHIKVSKGFDILNNVLARYIITEFVAAYGTEFWTKGVMGTLFDDQKRDLPATCTPLEAVKNLDIMRCLLLMDVRFNDVFRKKLSRDCRNWVMELKGTRNKWAHRGVEDFSDSDTWRALDTMSRLCEQIDADGAEDINKLIREVRYGSEEGSVAVTSNQQEAPAPKKGKLAETVAVKSLPSWRDIMEPHQDVAEGRYRNAEFAADLAQVARGEGSFEYRDPVEFFGRTYVTEGMKGLLVQSLKRLAGQGGEPVIQLKTAFGGGKTHSMLALYHMVHSPKRVEKIPNVRPVLEAVGVNSIPDAHVAVIVGTSLNPAKSKRPSTMPGITVNTVWGEIAYQLAESTGKPDIYNYVKEADKRGVSPGSDALKQMMDACGDCLILMDELVAYAKKLYGHDDLPAGTFDNFISFIQEITEAARASKSSLVVASIPESNIEIGGEAGQQALEAIEHTFGRMEAIWKPVSANEGFEVVRRRLFLNCKDDGARDLVCNAFSKMYNENPTDFPVDAKELDYRDRMVACYPIHPEVFDRLYEDWATLERFQRTRGVLRLMAAIIHELWMSQDGSPMIMPGSFPFDIPAVRDELTRYLDDQWNGVVDSEVDGKNSVPYKSDKSNVRYGNLLASRRVARTVMLGSAPDVEGQNARGIEKSHIRLGAVQPGESIAIFSDALSSLKSQESYLYSDASDNRFWFDTRPTLRKVVEDRAQQISDDDAIFEIENRLRKQRKIAPIEGLHIAPRSSMDVPDEQTLRMVILPPKTAHRANADDSPALIETANILNKRGSSPRTNKNMLVFVAADQSLLNSLISESKRYLAWESIKDDREALNLDAAQDRETTQNINRTSHMLDAKIEEAYSWLIVPHIDLEASASEIVWEIDRISGSSEGIVRKAVSKLRSNDAAIDKWAPALLRMELDRVLWRDKDHLQIKQLWNYLCEYCYLPRLESYGVLEDAIIQGLGTDEFFGIASGVTEDRYLQLTLGTPRMSINVNDYLVKPTVAEEQIAKEQAEKAAKAKAQQDQASSRAAAETIGTGGTGNGFDIESPETTEKPGSYGYHSETTPSEQENAAPTVFKMSASVDTTRAIKDIRTIVEEVVSQLNELDGATIELKLDVTARDANGIPVPVTRAISENCKTLGIDDFRFDNN